MTKTINPRKYSTDIEEDQVVEVFKGDNSGSLGYGTIVGYEAIEFDKDWIFSPIIMLKNGKVVGGWECWWYLIYDEEN